MLDCTFGFQRDDLIPRTFTAPFFFIIMINLATCCFIFFVFFQRLTHLLVLNQQLLVVFILAVGCLTHPHLCHYRIRSNKKMLLLVGGLPPGPDRLPSNLVQYYDDEKKTWKILTSEWPSVYFWIDPMHLDDRKWVRDFPSG